MNRKQTQTARYLIQSALRRNAQSWKSRVKMIEVDHIGDRVQLTFNVVDTGPGIFETFGTYIIGPRGGVPYKVERTYIN